MASATALQAQLDKVLDLAKELRKSHEEVRKMLYLCVRELSYVQSVENCASGLCASSAGKELIERGMKLLDVPDLSAEELL